jgi:hypothetical protein
MLNETTWSNVSDAIGALAPYVFDEPRVDSDILRAEGVRYLTRLVAGGVMHAMEQGDSDYPKFVQPLTSKLQWGLPAVDSYYLVAAVRGGQKYRVWGHRGTARIFDIEVYNGDICDLATFTLVGTSSDDFVVGEGGEVEFILSSEEQEGNWVKLPDGEGTVLIRQYFYDWDNEEPGLLHIERVGATYPPPVVTTAGIERRAGALVRFLSENPRLCALAVEPYYAADPSTVLFSPIAFGFQDLLFGKGHYACEPEQAVIIETPEPDCFYWNYQLCNHHWEALDWNVRQTTLNGHQATIDDDGYFRAVIANTDPGVPNWLDTAGRTSGLIAARYYKPGAIIQPKVRVVPLNAIRDELPATTPVVTPGQRQDVLRRRMIGTRRTWRE